MVAADETIARLAAERMELVTRSILLDEGVTASAIAHRLRRKRLHQEFRGVYATTARLSVLQHALAAVLACGMDAVLSHGSAAWLWRMLAGPVLPFEVLRAGVPRRGPDGIRLHRTNHLRPNEVTVHRGVPVTTPARTLLDLAAAGAPGLPAALDEAQVLRLVRPEPLLAMAGRRRGAGRLAALLADAHGYTHEGAERRLRALVLRAEIERPEFNAEVAGRRRDAYWPAHGLVLEVDGWATHGHRTAFEADRLRDQEIVAAGLVPLRVTWRQLTQTPEAVAARLGAALAARRAALATVP